MATSSMDVICEIAGNVQRCNDPVRTYSFFVTDVAIILVAAVIVYRFIKATY